MNNHEICEYALNALKAAGADMAQCRVACGREDELTAESGKFSLMRTVFSTSIAMKAIKDMKKGLISINQADKASIDEAVALCMDAAASSVPDEAEGISEIIENKTLDNTGSEYEADLLYDRLHELIEVSKTKYPHVNFETAATMYSSGDVTFMNTNGVELGEKYSQYSFETMFSAKDGEKTSSFNGYGARFTDFHKPLLETGIFAEVLAESENSTETVPFLGKCEGTVIVTPAALPDILYSVVQNFLSDFVIIENTSIWKNAIGTCVAEPCFTLRAAPYDKGVVCGGGVTSDGYMSENMDIIVDGVLQNFLLTQYGAAKTGKNRSVNYGDFLTVDAGDTSLDDMIKGVKHGVLIGRFSGGSPGVSGDISGVAKNSFLIEDGKVGKALSETMISANLAKMLKSIEGISKERVTDGTGMLPWIAFGGVTISGSGE